MTSFSNVFKSHRWITPSSGRTTKTFSAVAEKDGLSTREMEILVLLTEGLSNKEIGVRLDIGVGTVRTHISHIFEKLHVRCRSEAVARYFQDRPSSG